MKTFKLIKHTLCVFSIVTLLACEDVLTENPPSALSSESYPQSSKDLEAMLTAAYSSLYGVYSDLTILYYGDLVADDLTHSPIVPDFISVDQFTFDNNFTSGLWSNAYRGIYRSNLVIDNAGRVRINEQQKAVIVSQAKALRAIYHWNLVRAMGDVPIYTDSEITLEDFESARTPESEVYDLIFSDLNEAATTLPTTSSPGELNANVVHSLLARIYLYRGDYANALTHAQNVIQNGTHSLLEDYAAIFKRENKYSQEHIWQLPRIDGETTSNIPGLFGPRAPAGNYRYSFWTSSVVPGNFAPSASFLKESHSSYRTSVTIADKYLHANGTDAVTMQEVYGDNFPYLINKFDYYRDQLTRTEFSLPIIRYADVLLIAAEALNEVDADNNEKYTWINAVRKRARTDGSGVESTSDLPDLSRLSQQEFRSAVLEERRYELAFEGQRAWDLKRRGEFLNEVQAEGINAPQGKILLFPIPERQIKLNSNLTQNPDW